ncbi:Putative uncharacterized protein [Mycobacterium tuberculosis variant bovis]|uniref:Uncharacterized protein n=1 Tax=Mycobacterium tuberculosis (strain CDC 1551 / Oshkosh) TaxID=83331 RepID=Q8VJB6_MYCTO|nr:hypothetical protein MT2934 [Mycobacterium tuberculosis CDC1551]CEJ32070.1 Putative uncharacterized protein [Mycobacterium tuberculosis variant bovis]CEJ35068.1 Putative uncharacterized protein [Mycobacterium tuberculosis variant bovis]CEJ39081.1 Putative uncharacterized protein [Mycobacterium tuberculosis variant bovis]CEJ52876.1 Putative uncharacterized protein [Mycobacterium tuberculosis variant caprae]
MPPHWEHRNPEVLFRSFRSRPADRSQSWLPSDGRAPVGELLSAVDVRAVIDAQDHYRCVLVVNPVQQAVRSATRAERAGQLAPKGLAHPQGLARQIAEREFDHCREDSRWQLVEVSTRGCGEPHGVRHRSVGASRDAEFGADLVFAVGAAGGNVGVGFSDRLPDSGLRQPVQRLLQRFPLVGADQNGCGCTVLGDGDLVLCRRDRVDELIELALDRRNRQYPHTAILGRYTGPAQP